MSDVERSRTAPRAATSSDVTRFRGVIAASIVAAIAAVVIVWLALGGDALRSPGPISRPHREAGLSCASCHAEPEPTCAGCHGAHPSTRPGHAALGMACSTCHAAHDDPRGLTFAAGAARRWSGASVETAFRPTHTVHVPLIETSACATCHDLDAPRDPVARCLSESGIALCFDEHRSAGDPRALERDAAWEASRPLAVNAPRKPRAWPGLWVLGAALSGGLALVVVRRARRRKVAAPRKVALPVLMDKVRLPAIDTTTCLGCYACVDACPYDVLAIERYVATVVRPKDCCGLTLCAQVCPNGSLTIREGEAIEDRPRVSEKLESLDQPGVYLAGDLTGAPLIRNAIHQGASAVAAIAEERTRGGGLDLVIVGAGPAGISAALAAEARGLRYEVFEQGSVAESIRSFPRGKLVFDQPIAMPLAGELWLAESTKEELLAKWLRIVRRERLVIRERHRVTAVEPCAGGFTVRALDPSGAEIARETPRVLLALGRRGTPRKLEIEIPDDALDRVHYSLADARSHAGAKAIVIGLGDVAMETAIALAGQPGTRVTLVYRGDSFARGKARNIAEVQRLVREARIDLRLGTIVQAVARDRITLATSGATSTLAYDALFVMIGSLPPWPFLEAAGVRRAKVLAQEESPARDAGASHGPPRAS